MTIGSEGNVGKNATKARLGADSVWIDLRSELEKHKDAKAAEETIDIVGENYILQSAT